MLITSVDRGSPGRRAGLRPGMRLISVNGFEIRDILDYRFHTAEAELSISAETEDGVARVFHVKNPSFFPLGLGFDSFDADCGQSCGNRCVFCFIDQNPKGMRESIYFKDDDVRMSLLMGNYVTLTNLDDEEIDRLVRLRVSPVNISVHATDPAVRVRMLGNKNAGNVLERIKKFAAGGITMNCQIVACPGLNDGAVLRRTLDDLVPLYPRVNSVSVVPVGMTAHRKGLFKLRPVEAEDAREIIKICEEYGEHALYFQKSRIVYASDELYLKAGMQIPDYEHYEDFPQLENGVGMLALMGDEFSAALAALEGEIAAPPPFSVATGEAAYNFLQNLVDELKFKCNNLICTVYEVPNGFFGGGVTVAGLLTGGDLIRELKGKDLGERLLITRSMLRSGEDVFLDDMTLESVGEALQTRVVPVENDGGAFLEALLGNESGG